MSLYSVSLLNVIQIGAKLATSLGVLLRGAASKRFAWPPNVENEQALKFSRNLKSLARQPVGANKRVLIAELSFAFLFDSGTRLLRHV